MKQFAVITKHGCPRCEQLKSWLKERNVNFEEWLIEKEDIKKKLLNDPEFIATFCDEQGCMVYTPVIYLLDDKKYVFKELFGLTGVREKFVKNLLELE